MRVRFGAREFARITAVRSAGSVDLRAYVQAFALLARNPQIVLGPFVAGLVQILLFMLMPGGGGGLVGSANTSITGLLAQLVASFGFAVALIVAEAAWRYGRAPFDDAWEAARRNAGGILLAALGFNFIVYVASLVGAIVPVFGSLAMSLVAYFFFIYTLPAASIGGIPGGAALNVSLERARRIPLATFLVTALYLFAFTYAPTLVLEALSPLLLTTSFAASGIAVSLVVAFIKAILAGYVALVLAKTYGDASYGRY